MMRTNTKKFKLLQFIGEHKGLRYSELERFICEMNGYDYDTMTTSYERSYIEEFDGQAGTRTMRVVNKPIKVRRHKGIWATNLTSGKNCILKKHCVKNENKRWILNAETQKFVDSLKAPVKSSLEKVTGDDMIKGNSVPVSVTRIQFPFDQEKAARIYNPVINALTPKPVVQAPTVTELIVNLQALQRQSAEFYSGLEILRGSIAENHKEQNILKDSIRSILEI